MSSKVLGRVAYKEAGDEERGHPFAEVIWEAEGCSVVLVRGAAIGDVVDPDGSQRVGLSVHGQQLEVVGFLLLKNVDFSPKTEESCYHNDQNLNSLQDYV